MHLNGQVGKQEVQVSEYDKVQLTRGEAKKKLTMNHHINFAGEAPTSKFQALNF